ncbi:MAG: hypothetical protein ACE5EG_06565 [Thermoanaerobaculia bacterium]
MQTRTRRFLIVAAAAVTFLVLGWATIIGVLLTVGGVATVQLHERSEDLRIFLPVPMAVVSASAATAGFLSPLHGDDLLEIHGDLDLGEWEPFVDAIFEGLEECPDVTFVEVEDHGDHVRVAKRNGKIRVEVRDPDISLEIAVPIRSMRRTVTALM